VKRLSWFFWEFVHQCVAHPLLFVTAEAGWAVRLHDRTEPHAPARVGAP
jgi:hypothetical protein